MAVFVVYVCKKCGSDEIVSRNGTPYCLHCKQPTDINTLESRYCYKCNTWRWQNTEEKGRRKHTCKQCNPQPLPEMKENV